MKVYLDNAATTPLDPEVLEAMLPVMKENYGNPSSIHSLGRQTRALIETSRRKIAELLNISPGEIFFTSGGTEADNTALRCSVAHLGIKHVISSRIEHHAVLHPLETLQKEGKINLHYVNLLPDGHVDLEHLEALLNTIKDKTLVSLMHANNEIGNLLPIEKAGKLCDQFGAVFHSDTVQTVAHYPMDLQKLKNVHFITGAAHKFHGPKGIGFLYINSDIKIKPFIEGGAQERNMRGGTENIYGIVGMAKALEIANRDMEAHKAHIEGLKSYMAEQLEQNIPGVAFNGDARGNSLYTILNVKFPPTDKAEMLLYSLDITGIAVSGGSACTSGSNKGSHVLTAIGADDMNRPSIRFSFSKYNNKEEIDYCVEKLKTHFQVPA